MLMDLLYSFLYVNYKFTNSNCFGKNHLKKGKVYNLIKINYNRGPYLEKRKGVMNSRKFMNMAMSTIHYA